MTHPNVHMAPNTLHYARKHKKVIKMICPCCKSYKLKPVILSENPNEIEEYLNPTIFICEKCNRLITKEKRKTITIL
jgi:hypothetical protein